MFILILLYILYYQYSFSFAMYELIIHSFTCNFYKFEISLNLGGRETYRRGHQCRIRRQDGHGICVVVNLHGCISTCLQGHRNRCWLLIDFSCVPGGQILAKGTANQEVKDVDDGPVEVLLVMTFEL